MEKFLQQLNARLLSICSGRDPENLYLPIHYSLEGGGKRVRPALMYLAYRLYRDDTEPILPMASAIETFHNFTLLHDDLMDNAAVRRGRPAVHKRWNANTAILSGDAMQLLAFSEILQCPERCRTEAASLFTRTAIEICEGQQLDMDFERRSDVAEAEYIEMIRLKTAVLLACALKMGAICAEAPATEASTLYDVGINIGLAFQLQDDYLDVFGDPKVFGKPIGGDISENKKTFMLIKTYEMANAEQRRRLDHWMAVGTESGQEKIDAVTALYNEIGTPAVAQQLIDSYFEKAFRLLGGINAPAERKQALEDFACRMMRRDK